MKSTLVRTLLSTGVLIAGVGCTSRIPVVTPVLQLGYDLTGGALGVIGVKGARRERKAAEAAKSEVQELEQINLELQNEIEQKTAILDKIRENIRCIDIYETEAGITFVPRVDCE